MKLNSLFLMYGLLASSLLSSVQAQGKEPLKYVDALSFRMINKGFKDTETPFTRLPKALKDSVRPNLWNRSECSSGLGIRFATNSTRVGVRYTLLWNAHMNHMADTGTKGSDLYILNDAGMWEYVNTARPNPDKNKRVEQVFVENLDGKIDLFAIIRWRHIDGCGCGQKRRNQVAGGQQSAKRQKGGHLRNQYSARWMLIAYRFYGNEHFAESLGLRGG